ncbi:MAG: flavoprotein [Planctomycetota bacterium]
MTSDSVLSGRRIVLAVTGSVAAYKAVELAGLLTRAGAVVPVILTRSAQEFLRPLSFEAITRQPVYTGLFEDHAVEPRHVALAEAAEAVAVAPATAQCLAKLALGLADDLLSCVALATRAPILLAPAMNEGMFTHPATQANLAMLRSRGVLVVGPEEGRLANGHVGIGRMAEPEAVFRAVRALFQQGALA